MKTPICDFVADYKKRNSLRLHMPGHKGNRFLGTEDLDITEIEGADSLFEADGIIHESENIAGAHFGARTFYSCEGSSLSIRAMLYLATLHAKESGQTPHILAGRNAHKTFLSAASLLDFEVTWLTPKSSGSYLSCKITAEDIECAIKSATAPPTAVYITSPDYLGNVLDIKSLSEVCHKHGALLLVDNAHGAYLKFLPESRHPIDLGADASCDSAHKTLPVLTGGAYLHISENAPEVFYREAKTALALFGSTSPSYLILQSLDLCNAYIRDGYREKLSDFITELGKLKSDLTDYGYILTENEPLKIAIKAKPYGCTGRELADILLKHNIVSEFSDPDYLVMMFTPEITLPELEQLRDILLSIPKKEPILSAPPEFSIPNRIMSPRAAVLAPRKTVSADESLGCVLAMANIGCPPAVPIVASGELIDETAIEAFRYYGVTECVVVKD